MKKISVFLIVLLLLASSSAFALTCKKGNNGSDECWTDVKVGEGYTTLVSRGHILVMSTAAVTAGDVDGFLVQLSTNSYDKVLGVAQKAIASGETASILVKGRGYVKLSDTNANAGLASGEPLQNLASGSAVEMSTANYESKAKIGTAIQGGSSTTAEGTGRAKGIYAYIDI